MKMMYANFFMPQIFGAFDFVLPMHVILQRYCGLKSCHGCSKYILLMQLETKVFSYNVFLS